MKFLKQLSRCAAAQTYRSVRMHAASLLRDEAAQDLVEYALITVVMALGSVAAMRGLALSVGVAFTNVQTALTSGI